MSVKLEMQLKRLRGLRMKKKVKAYLLVAQPEGNIQEMGKSQIYVFLDEDEARNDCNGRTVISIPCEVSYELPRKARKKV